MEVKSEYPVIPFPGGWYSLLPEQKIDLLNRKTDYMHVPCILSDAELAAMASAQVLEKAS